MDRNQPLVSVGIPTYNRAALLSRSIESALSQDYKNIEVLVSDNASTDETETVCLLHCGKDSRLKYIRHSNNRGAVINFYDVLMRASGQFFMWLGDDDWIDAGYISSCVKLLISDPDISLVSGVPKYYRDGEKIYDGNIFSLLHDAWWVRVVFYYGWVADNGMFYGLMRTQKLRKIEIWNTMGGDWHLIANIVSIGKAAMVPEVSVHRELGGASASYRHIAKSLGLPLIQAMFPMSTIACGAFNNIVFKAHECKKRSIFSRIILAGFVFSLILIKAILNFIGRMRRLITRLIYSESKFFI
ncbi:glycosyltransferase family 2 protein [Methylomonas sp. SURF-2]|uniref:Glycosyltransferase family 2 protein n=1 Tax=Methylomonas subterranea TaxID=2952225 RepID=A0ABT1TL57_9GAMM|nr:glycosyltransferase family 2 protein [Methylomonas sp. SURF-2]MCQ8105484.1 glycosyltransferase family 2 protein [Methylomonas sp. SURF-2]